MDKALTKQNGIQRMTKDKPLSEEQIGLIKKTVAKNASDDELQMFLYLAKNYELDPFLKQICFIKRRVWNPYKNGYEEIPTIMTTRDGFLSIAHRSKVFDGMESDIIENDKGDITGAYAKVYRKDMTHPIEVKVRFREYCVVNTKTQKPQALWNTKPGTMILKVAESQALRRAFDISNIYAQEEMEKEIDLGKKNEIEYAAQAIETTEKLYSNPDDYKKHEEDVLTRLLDALESAQDTDELYRVQKSLEKEMRTLNKEGQEYANLCIESKRENIISGTPFKTPEEMPEISHNKPTEAPKGEEATLFPSPAPDTPKTPEKTLDEQNAEDKAYLNKAVNELKGMTTALEMKTWLDKNRPRIKQMLSEYQDYFKHLFVGKWDKVAGSSQIRYKW